MPSVNHVYCVQPFVTSSEKKEKQNEQKRCTGRAKETQSSKQACNKHHDSEARKLNKEELKRISIQKIFPECGNHVEEPVIAESVSGEIWILRWNAGAGDRRGESH